MFEKFLQLFNDLPKLLSDFTTEHGAWVYVLLFAIIFAETGLVIIPFLPGDSLLFTVGALAARPDMNLSFWGLFFTMVVAGVLGDAVNYHLGQYFGPRVFSKDPAARIAAGEKVSWLERMLNRRHLDRANEFYKKYGGKAVVLGRFVPIVRTFVPFVAGAGAMEYKKFFFYNVAGAFLWIGVCMAAGWYFGNQPWVQKNFEAVVLGIIVVSILPVVIEVIIAKRAPKGVASGAGTAQES
ncbi:MAG: VTT domain-containing protein [Phycisphaerales bacterium]